MFYLYNQITGYDLETMAETFDFINMMAYDLHGQWESKVDHHSPLYRRSWEEMDNTNNTIQNSELKSIQILSDLIVRPIFKEITFECSAYLVVFIQDHVLITL